MERSIAIKTFQLTFDFTQEKKTGFFDSKQLNFTRNQIFLDSTLLR